jgi:hypothetical protein
LFTAHARCATGTFRSLTRGIMPAFCFAGLRASPRLYRQRAQALPRYTFC